MQMHEVDLSFPVFESHPPGWRSPAELASGFALAWALEMVERERLAPPGKAAEFPGKYLPDRFQWDSLGQLVKLDSPARAIDFKHAPHVRLTALAGTWNLFDILNRRWQIREGDMMQFSELLAYVTADTTRLSLYGRLEASISKCLLAVRLRRAYQGQQSLDLSEQWFITGDEDLTVPDWSGAPQLLFRFGGEVPLTILAQDVVTTIWATARLTVDRLGPRRVIYDNQDRVEALLDILDRGAARAVQARQEMTQLEWMGFNYWPGWD